MCNDLGVVLVGLLSICGLRVPNWLTSPNSTSRRVCQVILRIMVSQKGTIVKTQFKTEKNEYSASPEFPDSCRFFCLFISTEGALRRPTTYDNHPSIPSNPPDILP